MHIHELLAHSARTGASDLHIAAGEVPSIRQDGNIQRLRNLEPLRPDETKRLIYSIMNERQKAAVEEELELDFAIGIEGVGRFRVNVFTQARGMGAVFRSIPDRVKSVDELGLPPVLERIAELPRGLVLVTGPTGSGKSTTLAAMIHHINKSEPLHILTIEDPIEFVHQPLRCVINQRELGAHTHSFANALRSALREDPDVILVGEMRDLETIGLALTASETGHLVFGTLHTRGAPDTIARIIDAFPAGQQDQVRAMVANSLQAVISQTLLARKGGGRACALEIMRVNFAVRNLIRENKAHQITSMIQTSANLGMQTMDQSLRDLYLRGAITYELAMERAMNPPELEKMIRSATLTPTGGSGSSRNY
ncbi:MAG: type IV pilus twitching motility protein PilT [Chthonomonadales bacterium]|nr:type IV pilus twitching motility protein PilT [Chthonomonadales bacterium]